MNFCHKVLNIKGKDNKTTICTYLVKQLKRNNPSLIDWPKHMSHVTKCAGYSVKAVGAEIDGQSIFLLVVLKTFSPDKL